MAVVTDARRAVVFRLPLMRCAVTMRGRHLVLGTLRMQLWWQRSRTKRRKMKPLRLQVCHRWRFARRPLLPV
jgi:hypothetical protein